jgi:hypothetical protein
VLQLVPESWLTWNFDVLENNRKLAEIKTSTLPESGKLSIEGSHFRAYREGMFSGEFFLEKDGQTIARAQKPSALLNSFNIEYSDRRYTLKKESWVGRSFVLLQGDLEVGSIRPEGFLRRKAAVSLPEDMPIPIQVFVVWLTILLWKREADAGAAASVAAST